MTQKCVVIGSGGHAKVLLDILLMKKTEIIVHGILDANSDRHGKSLYGIPIIGNDSWLVTAKKYNVSHFVVGLGSVGDSNLRERIYQLGITHQLTPLSIIHPSAIIAHHVELGTGVQIMANAVINTNTRIMDNVIINTGSIIEHDCVIGSHAHIATGAQLAGGVHIGQGTHVGAGATIRQSITVGDYAIIGLGAGVVNDIQSHTTVVGLPAKPIQ